MSHYTVIGVEEVYDALDDYEHANMLPPVGVDADSLESAISQGIEGFEQYIAETRKGFFSSGMFIPKVLQVLDDEGYLVFQDSQYLVRIWPYSSDERGLIEQVPKVGNRVTPQRLCFISYNHKDEAFARQMYSHLLRRRYFCWYAPENPSMPQISLEHNQVLREKLAKAIRAAGVILVAVSEHSASSTWVEFEILTAFEEANRHGVPAVFGLQISPPTSDSHWIVELNHQGRIRDYSRWQDPGWFVSAVDILAEDMAGFLASPKKR